MQVSRVCCLVFLLLFFIGCLFLPTEPQTAGGLAAPTHVTKAPIRPLVDQHLSKHRPHSLLWSVCAVWERKESLACAQSTIGAEGRQRGTKGRAIEETGMGVHTPASPNQIAPEADGPFGGPPPIMEQGSPSWTDVRVWAARNGFATPQGLATFMSAWRRLQAEADNDPRAVALALALTRGPCPDPEMDYPDFRGMWATAMAMTSALSFLEALAASRLLAQARLPPPRQSADAPVPAGTLADPLFDPLYRYPDGTLTPYWPPTRPSFEAYIRQARLDFLDHAPEPDPHRAIVDECRLGSIFGRAELVTSGEIDAHITSLVDAHAQSGVYTGDLPRVPSHPVLAGPRTFGALSRREVMAPVVVMVSVNPRRPVAEALQGGQVFARYPNDGEGDATAALVIEGNAPAGESYSIPAWAVRGVLADLLAAAQSGQAERVGLHPMEPGALVSDARGARVLTRDQMPQRRAVLSAPASGLKSYAYAGAYDINDFLAAAKARAVDASARIMRRLAADNGNAGLMGLAARAYRGPVGTGSLPAEVDAFVAPYVAARGCAADAADTDRANTRSAARLLGIDPDSFLSHAALCAELAEILDPSARSSP